MNTQETEYEVWNVCLVGHWTAVQYREKQTPIVLESVVEKETLDEQ